MNGSPTPARSQGVMPMLARDFYDSHTSTSPLAKTIEGIAINATRHQVTQNQRRGVSGPVEGGGEGTNGSNGVGDIFSWSDQQLADQYQVSLCSLPRRFAPQRDRSRLVARY